jgi:uncharacterized protein with HEPN domain
MKDRTRFRMLDVIDAVDQIHSLLAEKTFDDLIRDRVLKAAFERFVEILSEASRHIPDSLKAEATDVEWPKVAAIGNHLRHAYHRIDTEVLWNIYATGELAVLREAVTGFLSRTD